MKEISDEKKEHSLMNPQFIITGKKEDLISSPGGAEQQEIEDTPESSKHLKSPDKHLMRVEGTPSSAKRSDLNNTHLSIDINDSV